MFVNQKQMKSTNILFGISIVVLVSICNSCDDDYVQSVDSESIDCYYCYEEEPQYVDMRLDFNMAIGREVVSFVVYAGYAFQSEVYMNEQATENTFWISVEPNQNYTVVAVYKRNGKNIHVINDCKVKTEFFKYGCDEPCHYVYEANCDLKLK